MILDQKTSKKATFPKKYGTWFWLKLQKKAFFSLFLSWCQIVRCQIVLVPNCSGAKLSWCQIVRFYYLGDKLSPLLSWCQIVRCQIVRCQIVLQSKSGTIFFISNIYIPKMKNKKKRSFILMRTQIGFNLKCIAQCICSKSSGLTFLDNVWFGMFERSLRPVLRVADSP